MPKNIINELGKYNILGRSGCCFPTALKWEAVKNQKSDKKYIICNGSEGEPGNYKDGYILKHYPEYVVDGIKIALKTIKKSSAYIYLNKNYYWKYGGNLKKLSRGLPIVIFKKKGGYLAGEETVACEVIEGRRFEPRERPPFVYQRGLWGYPTLVNNIETFYCVGKIAKKEYENERFYTITGAVKKPGVFKLNNDLTIKQILEETENYPGFDFFVQAGGGAMGEILLSDELGKQIEGAGSIIVFNRRKAKPLKLIKKWAEFFLKENCDKCVPCREGIFRIYEMSKAGKIDRGSMDDILFSMKETSFCPLGRNAYKPFKTLIDKVIK